MSLEAQFAFSQWLMLVHIFSYMLISPFGKNAYLYSLPIFSLDLSQKAKKRCPFSHLAIFSSLLSFKSSLYIFQIQIPCQVICNIFSTSVCFLFTFTILLGLLPEFFVLQFRCKRGHKNQFLPTDEFNVQSKKQVGNASDLKN